MHGGARALVDVRHYNELAVDNAARPGTGRLWARFAGLTFNPHDPPDRAVRVLVAQAMRLRVSPCIRGEAGKGATSTTKNASQSW